MLVFRAETPTGRAFLNATRRSGLDISRADRVLERRSHFAVANRRGRVTRYQLTPDGIHHCEALIRRLHSTPQA
jgi:hypothetical protein